MAKHFFIAGAQRSGTTYLYELLDAHPLIDMAKPCRPEPKFFIKDELFQKGWDYYNRHYFPGNPQAPYRGEKSSSYMEYEVAAKRMAQVVPDAKVVFLLREPLDRAISNYFFSVNNGIETLSIQEAFAHEAERAEHFDRSRFSVSPYAYLQRGHYMKYLQRFEKHLSRDALGLFLYEDLVQEPGAVLEKILTFLGVDASLCPPAKPLVVNASIPDDQRLTPGEEETYRKQFKAANQLLQDSYGLNLERWGR